MRLLLAVAAVFVCASASAPHDGIKTAHLVWMNHLDVGFTNLISSVMNDYFHIYFPRAINTSKALNVPGEQPVFVYTSHAYLLDMFLNCPARMGLNCTTGAPKHLPVPVSVRRGAPPYEEEYGLEVTPDDNVNCIVCPNASLVADVIAAVEAGIITWHAYPHNAEPELTERSMYLEALASVRRLDARFAALSASKTCAGCRNKTVISQRDVPGLTRGVVPLLVDAGIKAASVGANAQVQPPLVPGPIFNWKDEATDKSVIVMLHPRGYGMVLDSGDDGSMTSAPVLVPVYSSGMPSNDTCATLQKNHGDWSVHDVVTVPNFDEALVYVFKSDNQGPPNEADAREALRCVAKLFPAETQLLGSTFDAFIANLLAAPGNPAKLLPTLTQEIGDTWIQGAASDPRRQKLTRLMMRERSACIKARSCDASDPAVANFSRFVLKQTEHTQGLHGLPDTTTWDNAAHAAAMKESGSKFGANARLWESSWEEMREYLVYARAALSAPSPGATAASAALGARIDAAINDAAAVVPPPDVPAGSGSKKLQRVAAGTKLCATDFCFIVSNTTGGLSSLMRRDTAQSEDLVGRGAQFQNTDLFQFVYRSHNQKSDFTPFRNNFTGDWKTFPGTWFKTQPGGCYDKPGLDNATCASKMGCAESRDWLPSKIDVFADAAGALSDPIKKKLTIALEMPNRAAKIYGAPDKVWVELTFGKKASGAPAIDVDLQWKGKTQTRLPESMILAFPLASCPAKSSSWELNKLGSWINARNVIPNGGASHLHGVGDGGVRRVCKANGAAAAAATTVNVVALDSALFSVGRGTGFPTPLEPLSASEANAGIFAVVANNIWNVNYAMWYPFGKFTVSDANERFRFSVSWPGVTEM